MEQFITHITLKFSHHGKHAGYDLLTKYMHVDKVINRDHFDMQLNILNHRGLARINKQLFKITINRFNKAIYKNMIANGGIHHFLYPENTLAFFNYPIPSNVKIISSFHQPIEVYEKLLFNKTNEWQLKNYRKTNIAIALGHEQLPILKRILLHDRIEVIPHGIDIDFFKPNENIVRFEKTVLVVGNWMRDFEITRKIAEIFEKIDKEVSFIIVSLESNKINFRGLSNIKFLSNISDEELLNYYNRAQILFLPLKGAIANNALLEAMSCNLPILISNLPTLRHFNSTGGIFFFDNNIDDIVLKISQLLIESKQIIEKNTLREFAKQYSWKNIAEQINKVYN